MRGKVVGSYKPPATDFAVWPEAGGYVVVAPSGARMTWHADIEAAEAARAAKQQEWDELLRRS